jgi:hypothetical protein
VDVVVRDEDVVRVLAFDSDDARVGLVVNDIDALGHADVNSRIVRAVDHVVGDETVLAELRKDRVEIQPLDDVAQDAVIIGTLCRFSLKMSVFALRMS